MNYPLNLAEAQGMAYHQMRLRHAEQERLLRSLFPRHKMPIFNFWIMRLII